MTCSKEHVNRKGGAPAVEIHDESDDDTGHRRLHRNAVRDAAV